MRRICLTILLMFAAAFAVVACATFAFCRDDGRYAGSALKAWFDKLASGKGLCCSVADGRTVDDPDIDTSGDHYRVRVDGIWLDVADDAVVSEPNKFGQAVVWPAKDMTGAIYVRCFLPGSGA